jgi:hypothetical protein
VPAFDQGECEVREVVSETKNPIISGRGVCDPHIKVFDGVAYLYASHDADNENSNYRMNDWHVWSSTDLKTWRHESVIRPDDFFVGPTDEAWAIDVVSRDSRYYLYFSVGNRATGVAVSHSPTGPWKDPLGKPLLDGSLSGGRDYDPSVLIDDDGQAYIVVGGPEWEYPGQGGYFIARLGEDLISLAEIPRRIEVNHPADDKASLNRIGHHYYLTWASHVSVSENVYGPYRYLGNTGASLDHGSYFEWNNQLYNAFTIFDPSLWHRASGICYVHQKADLMFEVDSLIVEYGVHRYLGEWTKIQADWYSALRGGTKTPSFRGGFCVRFGQTGTITFTGVEGGEDARYVVLCGAAAGSHCRVTITIDNLTTVTSEIARTGELDGPRFFVHKVPLPVGVRNTIEFSFDSDSADEIELAWWSIRGWS